MPASADPSIARLYRALYRIRRVEEEIVRLYPTDKIKSPVHLSLGQESVAVGVCDALAPADTVFATYRGHAAYLAKGGDLNRMIAELYGKADGCARGKAGSMHLVDAASGFMGTSAVVATSIPQAVGYALALKMQRKSSIVACFFGDGAMDEGACHESLNFAALKSLPILFVCENNLYAIFSHIRDRMKEPNICERAWSYRIKARRIEDGDVLALRAATVEAAAEIRAGGGPRFFEAMTMRWAEHVGPGDDLHLGYRTKEELDAWRGRDQVKRLAGMLAPPARAEIERAVEAEIAAAIAFAEQSPFPADDELHAHVFHG
jgi:TPP-dependent pyruvate/acetoin dehydrogenase alpha subunit